METAERKLPLTLRRVMELVTVNVVNYLRLRLSISKTNIVCWLALFIYWRKYIVDPSFEKSKSMILRVDRKLMSHYSFSTTS